MDDNNQQQDNKQPSQPNPESDSLQSGVPSTGGPQVVPPVNSNDGVQQVKGVTYLAYLGILLVIPILMHPNNQFVKFHVNQGLVLAIFYMVIQGFIQFAPIPFIELLSFPLAIFCLVAVIMGLVNVGDNKMKRLPLIGSITIIK